MNFPMKGQIAGQETVHAKITEVMRLRFELHLGYQQIVLSFCLSQRLVPDTHSLPGVRIALPAQ
jgi:hypothetical protein